MFPILKELSANAIGRVARARFRYSGALAERGNLPFSAFPPRLVRWLLSQVEPQVRQRRFIFVVSSGRAGSGFLAQLLATAPNAVAEHEPRPRMIASYLRMVETRPLRDSLERRQVKLLGIINRTAHLPHEVTYAETSHMFIKTFHDVVMPFFPNVDVIVLRRSLVRVLRSFIELGYFSDKNGHWRHWLHDPFGMNCVAEPVGRCPEMDQYDRCIAYLLDIEARAQGFRNLYPNARIHEVVLDTLVSPHGAKGLFDRLGLEWSAESERVCRTVANARKTAKKYLGLSASLEECQERLERYLQRARAAGCRIPALPIDV